MSNLQGFGEVSRASTRGNYVASVNRWYQLKDLGLGQHPANIRNCCTNKIFKPKLKCWPKEEPDMKPSLFFELCLLSQVLNCVDDISLWLSFLLYTVLYLLDLPGTTDGK